MKAARSLGRTRIESMIRTCASSPASKSSYTIAVDTPSCSATSFVLRSRSRPPYRTPRSARVGRVVLSAPVLAGPADLSFHCARPLGSRTPGCLPPDLGSNRVTKSLGNSANGWDGWTEAGSAAVRIPVGCDPFASPAMVVLTIWDQECEVSNSFVRNGIPACLIPTGLDESRN